MAAIHSTSSQVRPPPLTQSDAVTSLLSLGSAAAPTTDSSVPAPIPIRSATSSSSSTSIATTSALSQTTGTSLGSGSSSSANNPKLHHNHHRRLGSTGKTRRRLSDAREASTRPLTQHSLLSLASLSLSTSPGALSSKPLAPRPSATTTTTPSGGISISANSTTNIPPSSSSSVSETTVKPEPSDKDFPKSSSTPIPITANGKQKKRGVDYRCESCAKIYRHPNCLNKHRWEHTRQWREASKFVLSKHQQVQLLEAATILSYMGTSSTSLPEDRSEWPSFLSGGSLPKVDPAANKDKDSSLSADMSSNPETTDSMMMMTTRSNTLPLSTSVPVRMTASAGHGPRMHDFRLPTTSGPTAGGIGVVGPTSKQTRSSVFASGAKFPTTVMRPLTPPHSHSHSGLTSMMMMMDQPGWTGSHIPSSSIRSESSASGSGSRSRSGSLSGSRSRSRSDGSELEHEIEEEEDADVDVEIMDAGADTGDEDLEMAFGVHDSTATMTMTATTMRKSYHPVSSLETEPVAVPYRVNVGTHPHGSYGRGEYGSFSSSSYGTANPHHHHHTNSTPNSLNGNGFPNNNNNNNHVYASYPSTKPTVEDYTRHGPSSVSRSVRPTTGISQREEEEEEEGMRMMSLSMSMPMRRRVVVKAEAASSSSSSSLYHERRWDGMEMEVDMDMD